MKATKFIATAVIAIGSITAVQAKPFAVKCDVTHYGTAEQVKPVTGFKSLPLVITQTTLRFDLEKDPYQAFESVLHEQKGQSKDMGKKFMLSFEAKNGDHAYMIMHKTDARQPIIITLFKPKANKGFRLECN